MLHPAVCLSSVHAVRASLVPAAAPGAAAGAGVCAGFCLRGTAAERRQGSCSSSGSCCHQVWDCRCCRVSGCCVPGTMRGLLCSSCRSCESSRGQSWSCRGSLWPLFAYKCICHDSQSTEVNEGHHYQQRTLPQWPSAKSTHGKKFVHPPACMQSYTTCGLQRCTATLA